MAEQKKGGEAQSLQTPSISYDNSNSKGKGNLSNNQTVVHEFSYFKAPIKNTHPYKNITLSDVAKNALRISIETGIRRANITRYIGRMKRTDRIAVVYIGMCPITKHGKVQFLTTKFDEMLNKKGVRR